MKVGIETTQVYRNSHGAEFQKNDRRGYTVIKVLPHLAGQPCDDVAMAYIQALRPSFVRIVTGCMTCDAYSWRVTVHVDAQNIIRDIDQEVEVGLPEPFGCGYELDEYIRTGEHKPLPEGGLAIVNARAVRKLSFVPNSEEEKALNKILESTPETPGMREIGEAVAKGITDTMRRPGFTGKSGS